MSPRIKNNASFLHLFLTSTLPQQKALLDTITEPQTDLISEIIHNLLYEVPIDAKERKRLLRRSTLKDIAKIKRANKYRRNKIKAYKKQLIKILESYAENILQMLED